MKAIAPSRGGVVLTVRVTPRASRNEVAGEHDGAIRIRLQAPPVEGKANEALVRFLAGTLDVPRRSVSIISGDKARTKLVLIAGLDAGAVAARLRA